MTPAILFYSLSSVHRKSDDRLLMVLEGVNEYGVLVEFVVIDPLPYEDD